MICVLLYFVKCICWSVHWIFKNARYEWHKIAPATIHRLVFRRGVILGYFWRKKRHLVRREMPATQLNSTAIANNEMEMLLHWSGGYLFKAIFTFYLEG